MGRPALPAYEKRDKQLNIRLTGDEMSRLAAMAIEERVAPTTIAVRLFHLAFSMTPGEVDELLARRRVQAAKLELAEAKADLALVASDHEPPAGPRFTAPVFPGAVPCGKTWIG